MRNVSNPPSKPEPTAKGLRQRRSSQVFPLVFRNDTQTAHEIRNGSHTREFYIRFGLLHPVTEPKQTHRNNIDMENIDTEVLLEKLMYWNHHDDKDNKELRKIEAELNIEYISVDVDKHNELQFTYYFEVDYGTDKTDQIFFIEIENGINNGTQINHADWGSDTKPENRIVEVLKDVILEKSQYPDLSERRKAQAVLNSNKQKFFDFHRQNNYDNYVTGGSSNLKMDGILSKLHVEYIYEEVKADVHFV